MNRREPDDQGGGSERRVTMPAAGVSAGLVAIDLVAAYIHSAFGEIVGAIVILSPVLVGAVLTAVILLGTDSKCERCFRLLRWLRDKPEP